jgi:hypothetical protein
MSSASAPSKGKEKHARVVADDDEVSSNEDLPLQRWLLLLGSVMSAMGGPPPTVRQAMEEVITP